MLLFHRSPNCPNSIRLNFLVSCFYVCRPPLPSDLSGPNQYVDYVASSTSPESVDSSIGLGNPTKMAEDMDGRYDKLPLLTSLIKFVIGEVGGGLGGGRQ